MSDLPVNQNLEKLLSILSPMGNISSKEKYNATALYKDHIMFALIDDKAVYFKTDETKGEDFLKLNDELPYKSFILIENLNRKLSDDELDDFLKIATKSYWLGQKDKIKNLETSN